MRRMMFHRMRRPWARLRSEQGGAAIVEFTIALPLLALLLLASVEAASYFWTRSRATDAAVTVGDLTTQFDAVSDNSLETLFGAAVAILNENRLTGRSVDQLNIRITSALACPCSQDADEDRYCFTSLWSHTFDGQALSAGYADEAVIDGMSSELAVKPNDTLIVTEMTYTYRPTFKLITPDTIRVVSERYYMRPRQTDRVVHVGSQAREFERYCPG